jgi:hypothetical protein
MSGDFQEWNPDPPDSQNTAPRNVDKLLERQAYGGCLKLALVVLIVIGAALFVMWHWLKK